MRNRQPPSAVWTDRGRTAWERDGRQCVRCEAFLSFKDSRTDRVDPSGSYGLGNLRTLCRRCYTLRVANVGKGLAAGALRDGIIPPDWRGLVWDD